MMHHYDALEQLLFIDGEPLQLEDVRGGAWEGFRFKVCQLLSYFYMKLLSFRILNQP